MANGVAKKAVPLQKSNKKIQNANQVAYKPKAKSNDTYHNGARPSNINTN